MKNEYLRNLPVPFYSQRQNDYLWYKRYTKDEAIERGNPNLENKIKPNIAPVSMDCRSCNISSVMMIMEYFGLTGVERTVGDKTFITPKTPKEFLVTYFNREFDSLFTNTKKPTYGVACLEDWYNLERIATDIFGAECTYYGNNTENINLKNVKDEIAAGYPVCISIGMEKNDDGTYKREGHVVVVRGFTKIGTTEYIILNDPWGSIADDEFNVYEISDKTSLGSYYYGRDKDSKTGGDNVIVRLSDFKGKLVKGTPNGADTATYFHNVMMIHAPLWNFPDGSIDFSAEEKQAVIYSKIRHLNGGYPLNKNNVWHTGVHLAIDSDIHAIGPGRLVAIRNSSADKDIYDKSFMLLEHQVKIREEIKTFYSLYLHLKYFDLREAVKNYFCNGDKSPYSWLNQLLKKMLGYNLVMQRQTSKTEETGLINSTYKNIKLYKVNMMEDGTLIKEREPVEKYLGNRCLINPLPIQNQKIYSKFLDPEKYDDDDFKKNIQRPDIYIYNSDVYFLLDGQIYATNKTNAAFEYGKIFYKQLLTTAKQLYDLQKGKVVSFNEVKHYNNNTVLNKLELSLQEMKDMLSSNLSARFEEIDFSKGLKIEVNNPFLEVIDLCSSVSIVCGDPDELKKIPSLYKKYMKDFQQTYIQEISNYQNELEKKNKAIVAEAKKNNVSNSEITLTWKKILQNCCIEILNKLGIQIPADILDQETKKNGKDLVQIFINEINKTEISLSAKLSIFENLIIWLEKVAANDVKDFIYFEKTDSSVLECKNQIILKDGILDQLYNIYDGIFTTYLENDIEIGKNEIIGNCGKYETLLLDNRGRETYLTEPQIHFEIFSEEKNVLDFEKEIIDIDSDILYNPKQCIEGGKDIIKEEADKYGKGLEYLDDNMLKLEELDSLYKLSNNSFLNEVALNIKSQWGEKENKTKYKFYNKKYQIVEETDDVGKLRKRKKIIEYDDYYNKVIKPFMWFSPNVFGGNHFRDGNAWFYHPLYFIEKLAKMELDEKKT